MVEEAVNNLIEMRKNEGNKISTDILGKITQIDIKAKMENTYIPYKTLTVELIQGTHLITFGINDAQNNFAIPAEFQIVLTLDSAVSTTLKGIIQLS